MHRLAGALALGLWLAAAGAARGADFEWLDLPAFVAGETPWLRRAGDGLSLSWVAREGETFHLQSSRYAHGRWRAPVTVASGVGWYNTTADFARVIPLGDGVQLGVWLELTSYRDFHYRPAAALSPDDGASWRAVGFPHAAVDHGQQGFVSATRDESAVVLFWIAGFRDDAVLWRARLDRAGAWSVPRALDRRVCACCRTAAAASGALAYRDRDGDEIRDIALIEAAATASEIRSVHADGWRIAGCPVNGPAIDERAARRAIAWFTAADDRAESRLRVDDPGAPPYLAIAAGRSRGFVDVGWLDRSRLAVSTVTRDRGVEISLVDAAGGAPSVERRVSIPVETGLSPPTLAAGEDGLYVALYDVDASRIRIARVAAGAAQR